VSLPSFHDQGLSNRKAIYKLYEQAIPGSYAVQKGDMAPCRKACPAHINVQGYVQMVREGKYKEALRIIMEELPLPGVLGRICPHPCEDDCRRGEIEEPVAIRNLKRVAADRFDPRDVEIKCLPGRQERVAIIGSGPAGLSAAYHLARKGILSTIYEALPEPGGMLRVGIPAHRLPREILNREIEIITRLGVTIKTRTPLGPDLTVDDLFAQGYRAVYLAIGAHKGFDLGIAGETSQGVQQGIDFLREVNLSGTTRVGNKVAVIGGGNVAIDVARCAVRLGAESVVILYRRTRSEMPAWEEEIQAAESEGVRITYLTAPKEIIVTDGRVTGLRCIRMTLGEPDDSGRRRPMPIPESRYEIEIDQLIPAIGQRPDFSAIENITGLSFSPRGTIETDSITYATGREGVFAGGDLQTGPWIAIGAIAAGREAAESIVRYLDGKDMAFGRSPLITENPVYRPVPKDEPVRAREKMPELAVQERNVGFKEVELGYTEEAGKAEAGRCLNCGYCCECFQCVEACRPGAVTLDTHAQQAEVIDLDVGAVVLSPGSKPFDPSRFDTYSYLNHPNVLTSMEFERILSASGPTRGHLHRLSDHTEPKKIAWLQCVGSRDMNRCDNAYCSSVCCMYAIKEAVIAKEHAGGALDCAIFFMDMRTHGKEFEAYYNKARDHHGIRFIRSRIHTIDPVPGTGDLEINYISEQGELTSEIFSQVVLSVGLEIPREMVELARRLGISLTGQKFCQTDTFNPVAASRDGVFVCGAFQGPKDIPQSVVDAGAAAADAGEILSSARHTRTKTKEIVPETDVVNERPRIGVFVCKCGINIAGVVDVPSVAEYAATLPYVDYVTDNLYTCSQDTQETMAKTIAEKKLNRIVVAACTPKTHEALFQNTLTAAGLNKYLFEMANIRNHDSWVHKEHPDKATLKAKDLVRMAVSKVALMEPLVESALEVNQTAFVLGGGISGMSAALSFSNQGYVTHLVERTSRLGGQANNLYKTWKGEDIQEHLAQMEAWVRQKDNIHIHLNTELTAIDGFVGNFSSTLVSGDRRETIEHGVAVLATGGREHKPTEYLYGEDPRVLTSLELDRRFIAGNASLKEIRTAVFIQCVGSREPQRPYCSRLCCTHSIENALELKKRNPNADVFILYRDIRTYGERELRYIDARKAGVIFVRYSLDNKPRVSVVEGKLTIDFIDHVLGRPIRIHADLLTLASAVVPYKDQTLAKLFKVPLSDDGFFAERHAKLGPSEFATDGVFLCGMAHYPKPIDEAIAQAKSAASRAITLLAQKTVYTSGTIAKTDPMLCSACGVCIHICPYSAPFLSEEGPFTGKAQINAVLCKGCGLCVSSCRSGAIRLKGFDDGQIFAQIFSFKEAG